MTFLEAIIQSLSRAGEYNRDDHVAPAAILRPDKEGQWEPGLRERLPHLLFQVAYAPDCKTGLTNAGASPVSDDGVANEESGADLSAPVPAGRQRHAEVLRRRANIKWGRVRGKNPPGSPWGEQRQSDRHLTLTENQTAGGSLAHNGRGRSRFPKRANLFSERIPAANHQTNRLR